MFTVSPLLRILEDYEKMIRDREVKISKDMLNSLYKADRLLSRRGILQMKVQSMLYEECWDACSAEEFFFRYQAREGLQ